MSTERERFRDGEGIVHVACFTHHIDGSKTAACGFEMWDEPSDYVRCMPNVEPTDAKVTCMTCLVHEERPIGAHRHG